MSDGKKKLVRSDKIQNTDNETTMFIPHEGQQAAPYDPRSYGQPYGTPQYGQQQYDPHYQQYYGQNQQPQYAQHPQYSQQYGQQQYTQPQYTQQQYPQASRSSAQRSSAARPAHAPAARPAKTAAVKKKKRSNPLSRLIKRLVTSLLIILLILFGIYSCTSLNIIKRMNHEDTGSRLRTVGALDAGYVTSVLLIGTDGRTSQERGRSDTMILASVNSRTKEVTLSSFMRDCNVNIPGYGWDKLNSAYSYGGAELLMDTIESNFNVKIDSYISVDFISFAGIVDAVGGLDLDVSDSEASEINTILQAEVNGLMGDDVNDGLLTGGGKLHLNGKQVLSYARIRYVGNADFERTERQRQVLTLIARKLRSFKPSIITRITGSVVPRVTTNMSTSELYLLSLRLPLLVKYDFGQLQIPAEGTYYSADTDAGNVLQVDFGANHDIIADTAFAEKKTAEVK